MYILTIYYLRGKLEVEIYILVYLALLVGLSRYDFCRICRNASDNRCQALNSAGDQLNLFRQSHIKFGRINEPIKKFLNECIFSPFFRMVRFFDFAYYLIHNEIFTNIWLRFTVLLMVQLEVMLHHRRYYSPISLRAEP